MILRKAIAIVTTLALSAGIMVNVSGFTSASKAATQNLSISGSTALLPIVKQAAEEYMDKHSDINITVAGGGSGTGLQQVKDGVVDIGNSDVYAEAGSGLVDNQIAIEPFLFIVNQDVLITGLTKAQVVGIFSGKITNWKEVGGKDKKISVIMRHASSGTRMTIQSLVMGNEQFTKNAVVQDSNGAVRTTVLRTPGAIGYIDLSYMLPTIRSLKYEGVAPTLDNVKNGKYKLTGIGHMYTKGQPSGVAKDFINYILSKDFQERVLPNAKFVPIAIAKKVEVKKINVSTKPTPKPTKKK